jgi:tetratricopeptide (TPR) repeat protein
MVVLALSLQWKPPVGTFLVLLVIGVIVLHLLRLFGVLSARYASVGQRALAIGCCAGLLVLWGLHRPPPLVHRLAVFPMQPSAASDTLDGLGFGAAHATTALIRRALPEETRVCPIDMVESVMGDSAANAFSGVLNACAELGAGYAVSGAYRRTEDGTIVLQARFVTVADSGEATQEIRVHPDSLSYVPFLLAQAIRRQFPAFGGVTIPQKPPFSLEAFAYYCRGQALFHAGTPEGYWEAAEAYRTALARDSTFALPYWGLAQVYNTWQRPGRAYREENETMRRKAIEHAKTALILDTRLTEAYRMMGDAYQALRLWDEQSTVLKQAIGADPKDPWNYAALARTRRERFQDMGFRNEGELCEQAVRLNTDSLLLRMRLIYAYLSAGALLDALSFAEDALALTPDHIGLLLAAGEAYLYNGRARHAIEVYTRAVELAPDNPGAYTGLANAYSLKGETNNAIAAYERGIKTLPGSAELYYNLGVLHQRHGHWEKAVPLFEQAIATGNHPNSHYYLAKWYEKEGNREKAIEHWQQRILAGDPYEQWTREAVQHLEALSPSALPAIGVDR